MLPSSTLTSCFGTGFTAGRLFGLPVLTSKRAPWRGHLILSPSIPPSLRYAKAWVQTSSKAWNSPSTLQRATGRSSTLYCFTVPGATSSVEANLWNSGTLGDPLLEAEPDLALYGPVELLLEALERDAARNLAEEHEHYELLGLGARDAAAHEVEELHVVDLTRGRAVGALDVVCHDLQ